MHTATGACSKYVSCRVIVKTTSRTYVPKKTKQNKDKKCSESISRLLNKKQANGSQLAKMKKSIPYVSLP